MLQSNCFVVKSSTAKAISKKILCAVIVITAAVFSSRVYAQGNLLVTPKRVIFDGSKRSEDLNLANIGKDSATYIISFIQIRMKEDGSFEQITQPDSAQNFADKNLRFFPRSVTLAPNEAQTVKVQLTRTNELKPGEYRSHLYFRAIPNDKPLGDQDPKQDSGISVHLIPVFGISIPVIIRNGPSTTTVKLSDVAFRLQDNLPTIKATFNRMGNMSVYGDVSIDYISPVGKVTRVGVVKGMAIYTPNALRNVTLALDSKPSVDYTTGKLRIVYTDQTPQATKLAEEVINL